MLWCVYISQLCRIWDWQEMDGVILDFVSYEVAINVNMLRPFVESRVMCNLSSRIVIIVYRNGCGDG